MQSKIGHHHNCLPKINQEDLIMFKWHHLFFTSVLIVLALRSWHNPTYELPAGWWVEQHRPPGKSYQVVRVRKQVRLPQWVTYLRACWQKPDLGWWLLLALVGSLWIWLWQKRVTSLMATIPMGEPLQFHSQWRTQVAQGNLEVRAMVVVSVQPFVYALPAPENILLLPAGCEPEDSPMVIIPSEPEPSPVESRPRKISLDKETGLPSRGRQRICLPIERDNYQQLLADPVAFRQFLEQMIESYPVLFPSTIKGGYKLDGLVASSKKMPEVRLRRIKLKVHSPDNCGVYTIAPSFVLPYMRGYTDEVEQALFLRRFGVPFWALTYLFGRNDMYWYRLERSLGRNSVVGTSLKQATKLPQDVLADEKHTYLNGHKCYIATTVAGDCIFGASVSLTADAKGLTEAYSHFKSEAQNILPVYAPRTVNVDGWAATQNSWLSLFKTVTPLLCFLHSFIKIRSRCKNQDFFPELSKQVWEIYHSPDKATFKTSIQAFHKWAQATLPSGPALEAVLKLCHRQDEFLKAYDYPSAYRTSTMLDRQMDLMNRYLFSTKYFHGHLSSAEDGLRAWALLHNFQPYCPRAKIAANFISPAHRLNGFVYHPCWLQNLLVSASMAGYRT
jgi:hypothetical protein